MNLKIRLLFILFSILLLNSCGGQGDEDTVTLRVPVTIEEVARGEVASYISLTGTLLPIEEMPILAEVAGEIFFNISGQRSFNNGDNIVKDQLLAGIENEDYVLNVRLSYKKLAMEQAARDLVEKQRLGKMGGVPPREVEAAERTKMDTELNYQTALLDLEKLNVKSPMSGILTEMQNFSEGQKLNANTEIGKVMNFRRVRCELNITNDDISRVRANQEVIITNFAYEDEPFTGSISKISPTIDPTTRTFKVEVEVDNPGLRLRPGMFVKADIVIDRKSDVIRIPRHLILTRNNRNVVFVADDQVAKITEVTVGLQDAEFVEIIDGLKENDRLIIRGYETLKDNTKVRVSR